MKSAAERTVEALTWASVVIWLGFALVTHILGYVWLVVMVLSIILLSSAIYQRSRGWHTSLSIWLFGIWMAVFSVLETVSSLIESTSGGEGLNIDLWVYLGVALVSMGVAVVLRMIQPGFLGGLSQPPGRNRRPEGDSRPYVPRRVYEDSSVGYTPSPHERASYGYDRADDRTRYQDYAEEPTGYTRRDAPRYDDDDYDYEARPRRGRPAPPDYDRTVPYDERDYHTYQEPPRRDDSVPYDDAPRGRDAGRRYPDYGAPDDYAAASPVPPRRADRRRPTRQPRRRARPVDEPSDLEARVEDIIRRSRERRNTPPEDLPY